MTPKQILERLIALETQLVEKLDRQLYISPTFEISSSLSPYIICWYGDSIHDRSPSFRGTDVEKVLMEAEAYVEQLPDASTLAITRFQKELARVIDSAPPSIDTTPLSTFNQGIWENLLSVGG